MAAFIIRHFSLGAFLRALAVLGITGTIAIYVLFQARHIIEGPVITITTDAYSGAGASFELAGNAENITALSLNGRPIYTDDEGNWSETVILPVGYTIVTLTAEDRYGRQKSLHRAYVRTSSDLINTGS